MSCGCEIGKKVAAFKTGESSVLEQKISKSGLSFDKVTNVFTPIEQDIMDKSYYPYPKMLLNLDVLNDIFQDNIKHISLEIPDKTGKSLKINLCEYNVYKERLIGEKYFHGIIENVKSFVTFTFFKELVYGTVNYEDDNFDIFPNTEGTYSIKRNVDNVVKTFSCEVQKGVKYENLKTKPAIDIGIWLEAQHFKPEYLKNLFGIVKTVYENEGISLYLAGMKIWDEMPFYDFSSFQKYRNENSWSGDVAVLLDLATSDTLKNISEFDTLCERKDSYSYCHLAYDDVPYSTLNSSILAHSIGHNFGSDHISGNCLNVMSPCHDGRFPILMNGFSSETGDILRSKAIEFASKDDAPPVCMFSKKVAPEKVAQIETPKVVAPKAVPKVVDSKVVDPKVVPKVVVPKVVAPKVIAPKAVAPKAVAPKVVAPKVVAPKVVAPKAVTPKVVAPKVVTPKAVAPKVEPSQTNLPEIRELLKIVKSKKCGKMVKKYIKVVGNGDTVTIKTRKNRSRVSWETDRSIKSSHLSGDYFPIGDTLISTVITSPQGVSQSLSFTIRVVSKN